MHAEEKVTRLMYEKPYELGSVVDGYRLRIRARGLQVLSNPLLNRGTAFTPEERRALGLTGLLPSGVSVIEGQLRRVYSQYRRQPTDLATGSHRFRGHPRHRRPGGGRDRHRHR